MVLMTGTHEGMSQHPVCVVTGALCSDLPGGHVSLVSAALAAVSRKKKVYRTAGLACLQCCMAAFQEDFFGQVGTVVVVTSHSVVVSHDECYLVDCMRDMSHKTENFFSSRKKLLYQERNKGCLVSATRLRLTDRYACLANQAGIFQHWHCSITQDVMRPSTARKG